MNRISQFFKKIVDKFTRKGTAKIQPVTATVPSPQSTKPLSKWQIRKARRNAISHRFRTSHFGTFSPLKPVGRGANRTRVGAVCLTRAFKDAFFHDYSVRLK